MAPHRILIDVPNPPRDLAGLVYLKLLLQRMGFDVKLVPGSKSSLADLLSFLPHVVILGQVVEIHGSTLAKYAQDLGTRVVVLRTEGTLSAPAIASLCSNKYTPDFDLAVDLELVWGPAFRKIFIRESGMRPGKVKVVGNPRFDFYCSPLVSLIESREAWAERCGLDPSKPVVVYASNLTFAAVHMNQVKGNLNYLEETDWLARTQAKETRQREVTTRAVLAAAKAHPDVQFLFKLHPLEDSKYYLDCFSRESLPNVRIAPPGWIGPFVKHADVFLHTNSTSATEAWMFDKPVLTLSFLSEFEPDLADFERGCDTVRTPAQFIRFLRRYLRHPSIPPAQRRYRADFIRRWYFRVDGGSTQRAADAIAAYIRLNPTHPERKIVREMLPLVFKVDMPNWVKHAVYHFSPLRDAYLSLRWKRSRKDRAFTGQAFGRPFSTQVRDWEKKITDALAGA